MINVKGKNKDYQRDGYMQKKGINNLRFSDKDVLKRIKVVVKKNGYNNDS